MPSRPPARLPTRPAILAATIGLLVVLMAPAVMADTRPAVPPAWSAFGAEVSLRLQVALGDSSDPAVARLQQYLDGAGAGAAPDVASPVVRLWFGPAGQVIRAEFRSLGNPQADRDLRHILLTHPPRLPPPADMRQPIVLRLNILHAA